MNILIVEKSKIPVVKYGGVERVIWWLGKELSSMGHKVTFLVGKGSKCDFADVLFLDQTRSINEQVPEGTDVVHCNEPLDEEINKPLIITHHGNYAPYKKYHINSVFISQNHAQRYNAEAYVHHGLDLDEYGKPDFTVKRKYFHFLGHYKKEVKNLTACIKIAENVNEKLKVIGGSRLSFKKNISYCGFLGGSKKSKMINGSKGLLFPVRWHEPFGLAITESMYFGCPVFGSTYGSLTELIPSECGFLSNNLKDLEYAIQNYDYNQKNISNYVIDNFSSRIMAENYIKLYEKVCNGDSLNKNHPINMEPQEFLLLDVK